MRILVKLLVLLSMVSAGIIAQDRLRGWTIKPEASGLYLVEVQVSGPLTIFHLRNTSSKPITAFTVGRGDVRHGVEYFQSDGDLQPGSTYQLKLGTNEMSRGEPVLTIVCVVFDDGSAQGDPDEIAFIRGRRLGRLFETERVKALLEAQPDTSPAQVGLEAVKMKIGEIPESDAEAFNSVDNVQIPGMDIAQIRGAHPRLAHGFASGVNSARQAALYKMNQQLDPKIAANRAKAPGIGNALSELRQQYRALSIKDRMFLTRSKEALQ